MTENPYPIEISNTQPFTETGVKNMPRLLRVTALVKYYLNAIERFSFESHQIDRGRLPRVVTKALIRARNPFCFDPKLTLEIMKSADEAFEYTWSAVAFRCINPKPTQFWYETIWHMIDESSRLYGLQRSNRIFTPEDQSQFHRIFLDLVESMREEL